MGGKTEEVEVEVFPWLKNLALAPEYHPTLSEFQDPIAFIHKIEKEASSYGICKIVPPPPKKSVFSSLNKSPFSRSSSNTFTTRQQQVGFCPRKPCPVKKPVWQSGDLYSFQANEAEFIKKDIGDEKEASEDLLVYSRQHPQRFGVLRPSKGINRRNTYSDDPMDNDAHMSRDSALKQEVGLTEGISSVSRSKFTTDSSPAHDLPSGDGHENDYPLQKIPKGKRAKLTPGDAAFSHKFEEKCYFRTNRRMVSTKQEIVESEEDVSDDLDEDEAPLRQMKLKRERAQRNKAHPYVESLQQIKGQKKLSKGKKLIVSGLTKVAAAECSKKQEHAKSLDTSDGEEVGGRLSKAQKTKTSKLFIECRGGKLDKGKSKQTEGKKKMKKKKNLKKEEEEDEGEYQCDLEGCTMSFVTSRELNLHMKNVCPVRGCGKKFFSHKYLVQHRRVHMDERPLKCPWKGCKMTFKWAWARTEHVRVHTGERPYRCGEAGCGQTFRFVSDFSRHKRKTGHSVKGKG